MGLGGRLRGGGVIHFHFPALKLMYHAQVPQVTDVLKSKQLAEIRRIFYSYTCSPSPQESSISSVQYKTLISDWLLPQNLHPCDQITILHTASCNIYVLNNATESGNIVRYVSACALTDFWSYFN